MYVCRIVDIYLRCVLLRLTISTVLQVNEEMMIVDDNGKKEILTSKTVMSMLQIGWGAFCLGWIINTSFYVVNKQRRAVFLKQIA